MTEGPRVLHRSGDEFSDRLAIKKVTDEFVAIGMIEGTEEFVSEAARRLNDRFHFSVEQVRRDGESQGFRLLDRSADGYKFFRI